MKNMEETLFDAVKRSNIEKIKDILSQGVDINAKYSRGKTILDMAVRSCDLDVTQFLIKAGADVKAWKLTSWNTELVKNGRVSFEHLTNFGATHGPCFDYYKSIIKSIILAGANVNLRSDDSNNSLLHMAAEFIDSDLVKFLIDQGAIVDARNDHGMTPLLSASNSHYKIVFPSTIKVLLEAGADPNAQDMLGHTPLHYIAKSDLDIFFLTALSRLTDVIKLFKKYKADFNAKDALGKTPAFYVALLDEVDARLELADAFFDIGGVDVNGIVSYKDDQNTIHKTAGQTMLHVSCSKLTRKIDMIRLLVKRGANIYALDGQNKSPLQCAVDAVDSEEHYIEVIEYLLNKSPRVEGLKILKIKIPTSNIKEQIESLRELLVEHLAKLCVTNHKLSEAIMKDLEGDSYFEECMDELNLLKETKVPFTEVTYYNLLVDDKRKLIIYADNKAAQICIESGYFCERFPIYSYTIHERFEKAIKDVGIFEKSRAILSACLPWDLDPHHVVIGKIISFLKLKELRLLCENM